MDEARGYGNQIFTRQPTHRLAIKPVVARRAERSSRTTVGRWN